MVMSLPNFRLVARRCLGALLGVIKHRKCLVCGSRGWWFKRDVLWPELIADWDLNHQSARLINEREGRRCHWCGASLRCQILVNAILQAANRKLSTPATSLVELANDEGFRDWKIAEINSAGDIHWALNKFPHLYYSEYGSSDRSVRAEDITALSYPDNFFDLVITSDTLEHVPDVNKALTETLRVIKPGGHHIFTTPVLWERSKTKIRARVSAGAVEYLHKPSFHGSPENRKNDYLVFYEFGSDFLEITQNAGFSISLIRDASNPLNVAFLAEKCGTNQPVDHIHFP